MKSPNQYPSLPQSHVDPKPPKKYKKVGRPKKPKAHKVAVRTSYEKERRPKRKGNRSKPRPPCRHCGKVIKRRSRADEHQLACWNVVAKTKLGTPSRKILTVVNTFKDVWARVWAETPWRRMLKGLGDRQKLDRTAADFEMLFGSS